MKIISIIQTPSALHIEAVRSPDLRRRELCKAEGPAQLLLAHVAPPNCSTSKLLSDIIRRFGNTAPDIKPRKLLIQIWLHLFFHTLVKPAIARTRARLFRIMKTPALRWR